MPVPTETFWNIKRLNFVFLASAFVLVVSMMAFIVADAKRDWQDYQRQAIIWDTAMTTEAFDQVEADTEIENQLADYERQIEELSVQVAQAKVAEGEYKGKTLAELQAMEANAVERKAEINLKMAVKKGELGPKQQLIERAILTHGENSKEAKKEQEDYNKILEDFNKFAVQMASHDKVIAEVPAEIRKLRASVSAVEKKLAGIQRKKQAFKARLNELNPSRLGPVAALMNEVRNAPLLDWFNPSLKVRQVVVPDVRTDFIFAQVETVDRCNTCHVNIDNPAFEQSNLIAFLERQIAIRNGQKVKDLGNLQPVVDISFWVRAAQAATKQTAHQLNELTVKATEQLNELRETAGRDAIEENQLLEELALITAQKSDSGDVTLQQWYSQARYFVDDIQVILQKELGKKDYDSLLDQYRIALIANLNEKRRAKGQRLLDDNPVLLGHPQIDLYASVESTHSMTGMGCTVCHEGSGQDTDFVNVAHTPRDIWVDAKTGAPVPDQLVTGHPDTSNAISRVIREARGGSASGEAHGHHHGHASDDSQGTSNARFSHQDVKLTDPHNPAPFAPVYEPHGEAIAYHNPADDSGVLRKAVRQAKYWEKTQHWHAITYMHWEKPMHSLEYIESSCVKCHTEVFDIEHAAPQLFEGRKLFAQLGCVNCHAVSDLEEAADVKQVGPNLAHVKHKLSADMTASWIWAPKALRPMTRMPHYFMLENNSTPTDILRTKVEVAAITHYLRTTEPTEGTAPYEPAPAPETSGDVEKGKALFTSLGCMACHTNMAEYGEQWITQDLKQREGMDSEAAKEAYDKMTYNQRHWYALEHLEDKITQVGPEISSVGTKLISGRTEEEARTWLIDWLKEPQHYSDYSIMPSFRLSDEEANDVAAYLLTLKHPEYKAADFMEVVKSADGKDMLFKLVADRVPSFNTPEGALEDLRNNPDFQTVEQQLSYLGNKMIGHYGCNGCHAIPGFEEAPSACANLDDWGVKDPHKVDHGYFDHAFYKDHKNTVPGYKVKHEGLEADAPQLAYRQGGDVPYKIEKVNLKWEHLTGDRRPWLYNKLHNPRVFDRAKTAYDGTIDGKIDPGRPYDKLKMPKFFLNDREVRGLVTYVTGLRNPLVSPSLLAATYSDAKRRLARGKQMATLYNCYGCHNIEGNDVDVHKYFGVYNHDGTFNENNLNWAPPRLIGQGSKTQPDWLFNFLQNVHPIRPWLEIRMPSFPLSTAEATGLVDYFAGHTQVLNDELADDLEVVNALIAQLDRQLADKDAEIENIEKRLKAAQEASGDNKRNVEILTEALDNSKKERQGHVDRRADWYTASTSAINRLRDFAIRADLATEASLSERLAERDALRSKWNEVLTRINILYGAFQTEYPYVDQLAPIEYNEAFVRGEKLFIDMGCMAGECHRAGDEDLLASAGLLVGMAVEEEAASEEEDDGYGDDEDEGYGDDDEEDYGDEDEDSEGEATIYSIAPQKPPAGAPNLSLVAERLQPNWVKQWLYHARSMQPGTRMQEFWPNGDSFYKVFPPEMRKDKEGFLGYTGEQQREYLVQLLYSIGPNKLTYNITGEQMGPNKPDKKIELSRLPEPPKDETAEAEEEAVAAVPAPPKLSAAEEAAKAAAAVAEPKTSDIGLHDGSTAHEGTRVVGVVNFEGKAGRRSPLRMNADPVCAKFHRQLKSRPLNEEMIVNKNGTLRNVFVYVKSGLNGAASMPDQPVVIDQLGCLYRPHVAGVMINQPVQILNSDPTLHNVKIASKANGNSNDGMPVKGMVLNKTYSKSELGITMKCDVHAWMSGILHVVDNPYFAVSDVEGRFEIKGLPPGKYTLEAVHESDRIKSVQFQVEVKENTSSRADVTLKR